MIYRHYPRKEHTQFISFQESKRPDMNLSIRLCRSWYHFTWFIINFAQIIHFSIWRIKTVTNFRDDFENYFLKLNGKHLKKQKKKSSKFRWITLKSVDAGKCVYSIKIIKNAQKNGNRVLLKVVHLKSDHFWQWPCLPITHSLTHIAQFRPYIHTGGRSFHCATHRNYHETHRSAL